MTYSLQLLLLLGIFRSSVQMPMNLEKAIGLRKWLIDGGAYLNPNVQIEFYPGQGYGLKCCESISPSDMICDIPEHMCLHADGKRALEKLTTQVAVELKKGGSSLYYPFLCTLPDDVTFVPAMWSEEKIIEMDLRGTQIERDLRDMRSGWERDGEVITIGINDKIDMQKNTNEKTEDQSNRFAESVMSVSDWVWARATLQARAFSFRKKSDKNKEIDANKDVDIEIADKDDSLNVVAFIPFLTLSNHDDNEGGTSTMTNHSSFSFETLKKVEKNQQVFNFYGELSFQQKILSFGWVDRSMDVEKFCITALNLVFDVPGVGTNTGNMDNNEDDSGGNNVLENSEDTGNLSGVNNEQSATQIEIKSNILMASVIAKNKLIETIEKKNEELSKEMALKITILKFEIREIIRKIEERGGINGNGMSREEALLCLENSLLRRKEELIDGVRNIPSSDKVESFSSSKSEKIEKNVNRKQSVTAAQLKSQSKIKSKMKKNSEEIVDVESAVETDGQFIRRIEIEAVDLLLTYIR